MKAYKISKVPPGPWACAGEWTSIYDIGKTFGGQVLTAEEYLRYEDTYVDVITALHAEAGSPQLFVNDVEINDPALGPAHADPVAPDEGEFVPEWVLGTVIRNCIQEQMWCRLESTDKKFVIHFGYDMNVYVSGAEVTEAVMAEGAKGPTLYFTEMCSPYWKTEEL